MTWDGFPPDGVKLNCKTCGTELSGRNGPRPAETYLGTATGECYSCERSGPRVESTDETGLRRVSYPPSCSAHRRDRRTYYGREGCELCAGLGVESERYGTWGSLVRRQCRDCAPWGRELNVPRTPPGIRRGSDEHVRHCAAILIYLDRTNELSPRISALLRPPADLAAEMTPVARRDAIAAWRQHAAEVEARRQIDAAAAVDAANEAVRVAVRALPRQPRVRQALAAA